MGNPDQNDLNLEKMREAIAKAEAEEMENLSKLLEED